MRGVLLEVPDSLLAERARLGLDRWDEMWEGVLHMAPAPATEHQEVGGALFACLRPVAAARGLTYLYETAVYDADDNWRIPDHVGFPSSSRSRRGVDGPPTFAVEIRSPGDETYDKLGFYAAVGLRELLVVDRDSRVVELFVRVDDVLVAADAGADGILRSAVLDVGFRTVGTQLEVDGPGGRTLLP